ncbi:MAG: DUF2442 domain-containing protein [Nitrospiraceae bacterium]|nr:DUF2442 domain-containing protein [Nitrospiraceae bacterium]
MNMDIIAVKPLPDHFLELRYADDSLRLFDMKPLLGMKPWTVLANPTRFAQVQVAYGTVVWPGEIDIAPETLWMDSVELALAFWVNA